MASKTTKLQRIRHAKRHARGKKRKRKLRRGSTPSLPLKRGLKRPKE